MKKICLLLLLISSQTFGAILWVGDSANCNQPNHYDNASLALLQAIINGNENDEIRLTNTVSYTGETNGDYILTNWHGGDNGHLTIVGGYSDCNGSVTGRTSVGENSKDIFDISANSNVRLKNLVIYQSDQRGIDVSGQSVVTLENVFIYDNGAGVSVTGGSYFETDEDSRIHFNDSFSGTPKGGGVYCTGTNSEANLSGIIYHNSAQQGANIYAENGCFVELKPGTVVEGRPSGGFDADSGGIFINNGGELLARGDNDPVMIKNHRIPYGAGLYIWGTGRATLINTHITGNGWFFGDSEGGAAIYAINGGISSPQLVMTRDDQCTRPTSCSSIAQNIYKNGLVYANNSSVLIDKTQIKESNFYNSDNFAKGMIVVDNNGLIRMSHSVIVNNEADYLFRSFINAGTIEGTHLSIAGNTMDQVSGPADDSFAWVRYSPMRFENSIFSDTQGGEDIGGSVTGRCNLIENNAGWTNGTYHLGTAQFINAAGNDLRQLAGSSGVDMCLEDSFAWSLNRDIEYQVSPVNENTNQQGLPGDAGGLFDAGYDEVYDNIGQDEFLLSVNKIGEGSVVSSPTGIACGTDCSEVYFNGTLVTLFANPVSDYVFSGWTACPLPNGNQCLVSVTETRNITAEFVASDLIFASGFD